MTLNTISIMLVREAQSKGLRAILDIINEAILNTTSMKTYEVYTEATIRQ
ncbi:hypothetical protein [Runella aurantiaca]|nr:hypothetical protein [Runella aurantiaca]